jgi:hypothetical protein
MHAEVKERQRLEQRGLAAVVRADQTIEGSQLYAELLETFEVLDANGFYKHVYLPAACLDSPIPFRTSTLPPCATDVKRSLRSAQERHRIQSVDKEAGHML